MSGGSVPANSIKSEPQVLLLRPSPYELLDVELQCLVWSHLDAVYEWAICARVSRKWKQFGMWYVMELPSVPFHKTKKFEP